MGSSAAPGLPPFAATCTADEVIATQPGCHEKQVLVSIVKREK
jgi:hypothetical protein